MGGSARLSAVAGSVALAFGAGIVPSVAGAALLPAQQIDAKTGAPPLQRGAAMGSTGAYAAFEQLTGGANRLYATRAVHGVFGQPFTVDRDNPVRFGALVGSRGDAGAVVVFEEEIDGKGALFSRRLAGTIVTLEERITPGTADAELVRGGNVPFDRNHSIAMNEEGAAVLCYRDVADPMNPKFFAAILELGAPFWQLHEVPKGCVDPGIDSRGNVAVLGQEANTIVITRIVRGELDEDPTEDNAMDQWTLEVSPGGQASVQGRTGDFNVDVHYKPDIAVDGDWQETANAEEGVIQADANAEDPFAALDSQGDGVLLFRDNKMNGEQGYYRSIVGGVIGAGGTLSASMSRQRSAVDETGHPLVAYQDEDAGRAVFHRFEAGVPEPALPLGPELDPNTGPNILGVSSNAGGDFVALVNEGGTLQAVIGDYVAPSLRPRRSSNPRVGRRVRLRSGAEDALGLSQVSWKLPRGVKGKRRRTGASIDVRFKRKGRYSVTVTAADRAGNRTTQALRFRVRAAKRRRG